MIEEQQLEPFRLGVTFSERVWGRTSLAPWYNDVFSAPVGESWLTGEQCLVETGPHTGKRLAQVEQEAGKALLGEECDHFPLLVKILFPQEKLSVQVHPDDADAELMGGSAQAKTECWYMLQADPGANVALGVKAGTTKAMIAEALGTQAFEALLHEEPVRVGDLVYVEGGTIHAIHGGVVILEVQQTSDTTYRLYDYGRPRELHLEDGMKVIKIKNGSGKITPRVSGPCTELIAVKYFVVERCEVSGTHHAFGSGSPECVVALAGQGVLVHGKARVDLQVGRAVVVPACCEEFSVEGECSFVRCRVPAKHKAQER